MWIRLALTVCLTLTARTCLAFVNDYQCGASVLSLLESGCTYVSAVVDPVGCEWSTQTELAPGCHLLELNNPPPLCRHQPLFSLSSPCIHPSLPPSLPCPVCTSRKHLCISEWLDFFLSSSEPYILLSRSVIQSTNENLGLVCLWRYKQGTTE